MVYPALSDTVPRASRTCNLVPKPFLLFHLQTIPTLMLCYSQVFMLCMNHNTYIMVNIPETEVCIRYTVSLREGAYLTADIQ